MTKAKQDASELQEKSKAMKKEIQDSETQAVEAENERDAHLKLIGNLVHDTVPVSDQEVFSFVLLVRIERFRKITH